MEIAPMRSARCVVWPMGAAFTESGVNFMSNAASEIYNYREAGPDLATSGQPDENELAVIANAGYEVIINLALHNDPRYSLKDEAASVKQLGLDYIHIPVVFTAPTESDLQQFFDAMAAHRHRRVWVHCAANKRVTAFVGLYRCLREGWPVERAFALQRDIWQPDAVWSAFIASQLPHVNADYSVGDTMSNQRPQASSKLLQENERVIVTEWRFAPGAETGWHRHAYDYVVVCLTAGKLTAETATGAVETELQFGQAYTRPVGVEHNIVNSGASEFVFVEIEIK
jgi:protein tyrosine phosphatase (PTP) superfamily phosphohydrolase (DUF442 family)/quercetin dioxygenase-like cupin family protein